MKEQKHGLDAALLLTIIGLVLFGLMMITSASSVIAERTREDVYFFLKHQLFFGATVGLSAFLAGLFIPYRFWRNMALPLLSLALIMLILVFIPGIGARYGEASRWIVVGPFSFQPTELMKFAFIVYLAALLERKGSDIYNFKKSVVPFVVIVAVISLLVGLQPDIGTLFIITAIAGTMVFAAGFRLTHLAILGFAGAAVFGILFNTAKYRLARIIVYLHPELDPQGIGYQINQALLAVGTGGLWGQGFGRSRQKYQYLPEPATDSIFAISAEELGLVRSLFVVAAFVFICFRGYRIARLAPDIFGQLLACGITSWITLQAFINIASIIAITPLTGVPLPFISYGGSALATILFASGILLNISQYTKEQ